ncbi:hypothetical protein O6012_17665 [Sphingomonas aerolata]
MAFADPCHERVADTARHSTSTSRVTIQQVSHIQSTELLMTKFKLIGAALALALPTAAFAAGSCCADMACCKDGADCCKDGKGDCCKDIKKGGDHAGHDMSGMPKK